MLAPGRGGGGVGHSEYAPHNTPPSLTRSFFLGGREPFRHTPFKLAWGSALACQVYSTGTVPVVQRFLARWIVDASLHPMYLLLALPRRHLRWV